MKFNELHLSCNFPPNVGFSLQSPHHSGLRAVARNHLNRYAKGPPHPIKRPDVGNCHRAFPTLRHTWPANRLMREERRAWTALTLVTNRPVER